MEEIATSGEGNGTDWSNCVVVYGIVGILTLYTGILDFSSSDVVYIVKAICVSFPSFGDYPAF